MKRSRLSYDEWKCITSKERFGRRVCTDFYKGYIGLLEIKEVTEIQKWIFGEKEFVVCDQGLEWLSILPQDNYYCITAMMNEKNDILVWYIDMIAAQGIDTDGVPYFDDLYLDLIVLPDGEIKVDDMDELEEALHQGDITQEQFKLAIDTAEDLKRGLLSDIISFTDYTKKCYEIVTSI